MQREYPSKTVDAEIMTDDEGMTYDAVSDIFFAIFGRCEGESIIAAGHADPSQKTSAWPQVRYPIRVKELRNCIPLLFVHRLRFVQYFVGCATFDKKAIKKGNPDDVQEMIEEPNFRKMFYMQVKRRYVKELVALVVDCDVGREVNGLTSGDAIKGMYDKVDRGIFPLPSILARSGRGVYFMWLLRSGEWRRPPLMKERNVFRDYQRISAALTRELYDFKADKKIQGRPEQWIKQPNTLDHKSGKITDYALLGEAGRGFPIYRLDELKRRVKLINDDEPPKEFPVPLSALPLSPREVNKKRKKRDRRGERWRLAVEEIQAINDLRGGMGEGCRHYALWIYFQSFLAYSKTVNNFAFGEEPAFLDIANKRSWKKAVEETRKLNASFSPPQEEHELKYAWASGGVKKPPSRAQMSAWLHVTREEAERLFLRHILPLEMLREEKNEATKKKAFRNLDRSRIDAELQKGRTDYAQIARDLFDRFKIQTSRGTLYNRRKALLKSGELAPPPATDRQKALLPDPPGDAAQEST